MRTTCARDREHVERVVVAQVLLARKREFRQVGQRLQVVRMHAGGVERGAVMRHVVVGVLERPLQALQLQGLQLVLAGGFDGFQVAWLRGTLWHGGLREGSALLCNG
jgi:hypothetical protein